MSYTSYSYLLIFLGTVFICYTAVPKKFKWTVLLLASYVFYWINSKSLIVFLLLSTVAVYFAGIFLNRINDTAALAKKGLEREEKKEVKALVNWQKRAVVALAVGFIFAILLILKYSAFFAHTLNSAFGFLHLKELKFMLPLGISYYTLQAAGYIIDVYRGKYRASENFGKVALFLCFFPQIVEGPIGSFDKLADPLYEGHGFDYDRLAKGVQLIFWGLFKKMVIADRANIFVVQVFDGYNNYSGSIVLLGGLLYTLQIYAEFSACMDIVTGSAQIFGVPLAKNFERPFFSKSVGEFWRRWHITLGAWLRDYVFYSVSLSKPFMKLSKFAKKHFNEFLGSLVPASFAMFFTWFGIGFWHGAGWKYIVYGFYYYAIMMAGMYLEPLFARAFSALKINRESVPLNALRIIRTIIIVIGGMMLFRADTVGVWGGILKSIFTSFGAGGFFNTALSLGMDKQDFLIIAIGALVMLIISLLQEKGIKVRESLARQKLPVRWSVYACLVLACVIFGAYGPGYDAVDFIYGQF